MENENDLGIRIIQPVTDSLFDDIEHRILSPLSCLREIGSHWVLEFDLPLVNKKDIKISYDENTISVEAKLKEKYTEGKLGIINKFEYFKKSISLPGKIDGKKITAKFQRGRLEVKIPKTVSKKPVKVS